MIKTIQKAMLGIILLISFHFSLLANEAILSIDTGGHQAKISNIIVTKSGDIITASNDKTIRVWDSKSGSEKRKILGQIGAGSGEIYAIALSPNEEYLAVGGFFENDELRIFNYKSGKLLKILRSHENSVLDLAFSPDGKYLASGSGDTKVKLWETADFSLESTIDFHTNAVYAVKLISKNGINHIVSAGDDNQVALHTINGKLIKSYTHSEDLDYLATNDNEIATCGQGSEILIFDNSLNLKQKIKSETKPAGLAYSSDKRYLIAGSGTYPYNANIYDSYNSYKKIQTFDKHANLVQAVAFVDNQTAISGGGNNKEIYIWNIFSKQLKHKIVGSGQSVWSVGIRDNKLAFGNIGMTQTNQHAKLEKSFDLISKQLQPLNAYNQDSFNRINSNALSHSTGGDYGYGDAVLNIEETGAQITKDATTGLGHRCYGWYGDMIVSGGGHGSLKIYNKNGEEVADLVGHTGTIWSIAIEGDRLVSGSDDQAIKVWDLASLKNIENNTKELNEVIIGEIMKITNWTRNEIIDRADFIKEKTGISIYKQVNIKIRPLLSLFIGSDNEWVMWSDSGYYDASPKGDKYIGWHINGGADKEALFYPVGRFKARYYKPELIALLLEGYSEADALAKLNQKQPKLALVDSLPPYITFAEYPQKDIKDSNVRVKVRVVSKSQIIGYKYLFDGRPITNTRALKPKAEADIVTLDITVPLQSGKLSVIAQNEFGYSEPVEFEINYIGQTKELFKPNLYILAIGVSSYDDKDLTLEFASKDAIDFANVMKKQKGKLYGDVVIKTLTNKEASKGEILDALEWLQKQTTSKDVAMLFVAGHGINDDNNNFYFLPSNFDDNKLKRTGVAYSDFKSTLSDISGKVLFFADACHSGNVMGKRRAIDTNGIIAELNDAENGIIVFTSSTGKQYSLEDKSWGNGAFTKALVEGLEGKADILNTGKITVDSLSFYVSERVKELTNGKQTPAGSKPKTISDFPIGVK